MKRSRAIDDTPEDLRWQRLADAQATSEASIAEAEFVRDYAATGDATRAEQEFLAELRARAQAVDPASEEADEALINAALSRFLADPGPAAAEATPRRRWSPIVLLGGLTTGLAAAASWLLLASPVEDVPKDRQPAQGRIAEADPSPPKAPAAGLSLLRGPASLGGRPLAADEPLALLRGPLQLGAGACVGVPGRLRACAPATSGPSPSPTEVTLHSSTLTLDRGRLEVEIESAAPETGIVWVQVAGVALLEDSPGVITITREENTWELRAEEGSLQLEIDGEPRRLHVGETLASPENPEDGRDSGAGENGEHAENTDDEHVENDDADNDADNDDAAAEARRPTSDPRDLLAQAQRLRGSGDYRGAASTYRRLIRDHGKTSIARTAQASLGQLYIGPLHSPAKALRAFRAYLRGAPTGAMAEEALRGEIDALRQLGRDAAADRSSADFLRRFPRSGYAEGIRRDLDADGR